MNLREFEDFVGRLTPAQIRQLQKAISGQTPTIRTSTTIKTERVAIYRNTCLLCFTTKEEEGTYIASSVCHLQESEQEHDKIVFSFFTSTCDKCEEELMKLDKEVVVKRAIKAVRAAFIGKDAMKAFISKERSEGK